MYRPVGYFVLIQMEEVEKTTESGIIIASKAEHQREQEGYAIGVIKAFGPTCYKGFEGCDGPLDWGVKIGDRIEFNRYDGKKCLEPGYENFRLITDQNIVAVLEEESNNE